MKTIKKIFFVLLIIIIAVCAAEVYLGYSKYKEAAARLPINSAADHIRSDNSYTHIDEISDTFVKAMVAVEDKRFYYHNGVDIIGTLRALLNDIKAKSLNEGGSTITQQLAKNIYFMEDESPSRKLAEMFAAIDMEKMYSKDDILELYFNVIYYGSGYYNIKDASEGYFGKLPSEISDYEATLLAGLPNAPSAYSPDKHPELAEKRRKKVVSAMLREGYITEEKAKELLSE